MANWKKIIVSGSSAHLAAITSSTLTDNNILIAGSGGLIENSGITFTGGILAIGANAITSTVDGSILSGSFSGSFEGDGSALTGLVTELNIIGGTSGTDAVDLLTDTLTFGIGNSLSSVVTNNVITYGVIDGGITETQLNASVAGYGIAGAAGTPLSLAFSELTAAVLDVGADSIAFLSAGNASTKIETVADLITGVASTGLTATNGQLLVDYGSIAGSAVQGNTQVVFQGASGEITIDSGATQTLGAGGTVVLGLADTISGNRTFSNNVTVSGDLIVDGTTTTISTTNLLVEDRFILLNSGSANPDEGGIVIDEGSGTGHAFIYEADTGVTRWGFNAAVDSTATTANTTAYASAVVDENNANHTDTAEYQKNGNIKIDNTGEIWIFS
tara:strand:- start:3513 stop:4676 length:1164 start_codon:yes stop_codon:yes gene_type:complete